MACYKFQRWRFRTVGYGTNGRFRRNIISDGGFARYEGPCSPESTQQANRCHLIFVKTDDINATIASFPGKFNDVTLVLNTVDLNTRMPGPWYALVWYGPAQEYSKFYDNTDNDIGYIYPEGHPRIASFANSLLGSPPTHRWRAVSEFPAPCQNLKSNF